MTNDLIKALELMTYPRHVHDATGEDRDFCAKCGSNFRNTMRHLMVDEDVKDDHVFAVATLAHAKTLTALPNPKAAIIKNLQLAATQYLTDELSAHDFISEVLGLIDGPAQREAMAV